MLHPSTYTPQIACGGSKLLPAFAAIKSWCKHLAGENWHCMLWELGVSCFMRPPFPVISTLRFCLDSLCMKHHIALKNLKTWHFWACLLAAVQHSALQSKLTPQPWLCMHLLCTTLQTSCVNSAGKAWQKHHGRISSGSFKAGQRGVTLSAWSRSSASTEDIATSHKVSE